MVQLLISTSTGSYPVISESGIRNAIIDKISSIVNNAKLAIITDENVANIYKEPFDEEWRSNGIFPHWLVIPSGEHSKNYEKLFYVLDYLLENDFRRDDSIIAFGGGVVGDLAGFAASIYLRGIRWFYIPTSLLAQVDASIGGKTGIHFKGIKNVIGSFYPPSTVLIDPDFLLTLPTRDFFCGLSEVIKMAILRAEGEFAIWDNAFRESILKRETKALEKTIEDCLYLKARIVELDEYDRAGRIVLNLGHTLGHALESIGNFQKFNHGEAVCIGTLFICSFSNHNNDMSNSDLEKIYRLFEPIASEISLIDVPYGDLKKVIQKDKKWRESSPLWVYPYGIGKIGVKTFLDGEIEKAWNRFQEDFNRRFGHAR